MRKILIADDEKLEREGIKFLLKKGGFQAETIEAVHGRAALEYLRHNKADILLTDVMMPFLNGLQLIEEANQLYPDMKCIVLSGFKEFEFARRAMELGVNNYIVKPVDPEEFTKAITEVWDGLNEKDKREKIRQKENHYFRKYILYQLVNGIPYETLKKQVRPLLDKDFYPLYDRMILIEANRNFFEEINEAFQEKLKEDFLMPFEYLNLNTQQSLLFFEKAENRNYSLLAKQIYEFTLKHYKESCYLAVSRPIKDIRDIPDTFCQVELLMENKFYQTESYIYEETEKGREITELDFDDEKVEAINLHIRNRNIEGVKKEFDILCHKYKGKTDFSQIYVKFIFSNIMKAISMEMKGVFASRLEWDIENLYKCTKIQEVIEITASYVESFAKSQIEKNSRGDIQDIKNFIYENYKKDISVELLAEKVCLSPSYVSYIFKKETGCNLSKFIKNYRMEKAKELLKSTQMKIVNICYETGYTNVSYFCQNFKYTFGVSPEKFRQIGE